MDNKTNLNIIQSDISFEMKDRYIEYAMSVIVGRALPDVRDGLKPVHRRILFAMHELGLVPDKGFRKCARIVGDVLGKYHPHGDTAVYDALVRMAQDFSIRYTLVNGHGNFGSVDGDSSAHMRYTEAKMNKITLEMLREINKNTVNFVPNFDGEEMEPSVLPSRFPNLLANGSEGIAVGMSTAIPSHNLTELISGILYLIDNPDATIKEIMNYIPAPDFATGAEIINPQDMQKMYETGRGRVIMRAKHHLEENDKFKQWVFTEIPYQANKSKICKSIADCVVKKDKILSVITDVRDESDRDGMRIVVEFKKSADENKILARLLKKTVLQSNYNSIFCALVDNEPKVLSLKQLLQYYIAHQKEVIARRTQFELEKAQKRLHILEAQMKATLNIDKTIELIKTSKSKEEARGKIMEFLSIDEEQSNSILALQLQRLTGLEIKSIEEERTEIATTVSKLQLILNNEQELLRVLKGEITEIKDKYGDTRRSALVYNDTLKNIPKEDFIEEYNCKIVYTKDGFLKKLNKSSEQQKLKEGDSIIEEISSTNKSTLLLFTNKANRYKIPCYSINICNSPSKAIGDFIPNIIDLEENEKVIKIFSLENESNAQGYIVTTYEDGKLAKINIKSFISANKKIQNCYSTNSPLLDISYIEKECDVLFISSEGKGLIVNTNRFNAKSTKNSQGNKAMCLGEMDDTKAVLSIINPHPSQCLILNTEKGKSKEIRLDDIAPTSKRNEERSIYTYITGKNGNQGNFILNCRANDDKIIHIIF